VKGLILEREAKDVSTPYLHGHLSEDLFASCRFDWGLKVSQSPAPQAEHYCPHTLSSSLCSVFVHSVIQHREQAFVRLFVPHWSTQLFSNASRTLLSTHLFFLYLFRICFTQLFSYSAS
jgi:hypothetical protein